MAPAGAAGRPRSEQPDRAAAATTSGPVLPIGHVGRWLTDADGRVVLLHGMNVVSKGLLSPADRGFGDDDIAWMHDNGFEVVRLGLTASALMPQPGVIDQAFLDSFVATAHRITDHGLLVLVDLHQDGWSSALCNDGFPPWMTITDGAPNTGDHGIPWCYLTNPAVSAAFQNLWDDTPGPGGVGLADRVAAMFSALASALGTDPGVLGYDVINEPWAGTDSASCYETPAGCPDLDVTRLGTYGDRMATAIRAHDPAHLIFAEPGAPFALGVAGSHVPVPGHDGRGGLAFHDYGQTPGFRAAILANAEAWVDERQGALLLGELGAIPEPERIDAEADEADGALLPWIWWSYADNDGGGALIRDLTAAPDDANLYLDKVDVLVRPHPLVVAGTPTSVAYDHAARQLDVRWSTTGPGGRRHPAGTTSEIVVPARTYPDGWHAIVQGGSLAPSPEADRLVVVADASATCTTVTVAPGSGPSTTDPASAPGCPEAPPTTATTTVSTTADSTTAAPASGTPSVGPDTGAGVGLGPRFTG